MTPLLALAATHKAILVWEWSDAPEEFRALSTMHGGDGDWIAFCPDGTDQYPIWAVDGSAFGRCDVSSHEVPGGIVLIGAHA